MKEAVLVNEGKNVYTINGNLNPLDMPGRGYVRYKGKEELYEVHDG